MSSRPSSKRRSQGATPRRELRFVVVFANVRAFVARKVPALAGVTWRGCPGVRAGMRGTGRARSFAHVGHVRKTICVADAIASLPLPFLVGILLHEFGHAAGNRSDLAADRWVFEKLGILIEYRSSLRLEWVSPKTIRAMRAV